MRGNIGKGVEPYEVVGKGVRYLSLQPIDYKGNEWRRDLDS